MRNVWVHPEPPAREISVQKIRGLCIACGWEEAALFLTKLEESQEIAEWRYADLQSRYAAMKLKYEPTQVRRLYEGECGKPGWDSDG